jgi:hypothetical protein
LKLFDHIIDQMEKEIEEKYRGKLWYVNYDYKHKTVYYGDEETVRRIMVMQRGISFFNQAKEYSPRKHGVFTVFEDAEKCFFEEYWRPNSFGNIVSYDGKTWKVGGFSNGRVFLTNVDNKKEEVEVPNDRKVKLISHRKDSTTLKDLKLKKLRKRYEKYKEKEGIKD